MVGYQKKTYKEVPVWTIDSIKLLLCIVYFYAGLAKLNSDWLFNAMPLNIWLPSKFDLPLIGIGNLSFGGTGKECYNGEGVKAEDALLADPTTPDDSRLYIVDIRNRRVRYIDLNTNRIYTLAGTGVTRVPEDGARADRSPLLDPRGVAEDSKGNVYVLSRRGHALRVVKPDGKIYAAVGTRTAHKTDGPALMAGLYGPKHI